MDLDTVTVWFQGFWTVGSSTGFGSVFQGLVYFSKDPVSKLFLDGLVFSD
jgi:hypothetical protein